MKGRAFPFASYRTGQREAIEAAQAAFGAGKRFVVVEAPTGAGKSAIGVTLAREAKSAYVVTAQKVLQDQYVRDFPDLAIMKGRSNYSCLIAPTHAAAAPCLFGKRLPQCDACPYFTAKDVATCADGTILNYAYYLTELNCASGFAPRELLVLDEAHNIEAALMGFVQLTFDDGSLAAAGLFERVPYVENDEAYFDFALDLLPSLLERIEELDRRVKHESLPAEIGVKLMQARQWLDDHVRRLELMASSRDELGVEWVVESQGLPQGRRVSFKPVTVDAFASELLFAFGERVLMLSATILDAPTFLCGLGIDAALVEVIRVRSSFPARNRPIVLRPAAKLTRHYLARDLPKLTAAVADIMSGHGRDKGVIHTHSYRIAAHLERHLPECLAKRLVAHHNSHEREAALARHLAAREATVLLTPSMTEGIDLAGDLSRWQIICKIPYPYLGDPQIARRQEVDPTWYQWRTCMTIVQAYGRSVRSADDFAVTYVLDADFPAFLRRQRSRFPDWFLEAVEHAEAL